MAGPGFQPDPYVCPQCGQPVLPGAPLCPNCGRRLAEAGPRRLSGVWVLLGGLALCALTLGLLFVSCWAGFAGAGQTDGLIPLVVWTSVALGVLGLGMMVVGLVMTIVQTIRR
jgi:hypothetical protein